MKHSDIQVHILPNAHQGRWDVQHCGEIHFSIWGTNDFYEDRRPWRVSRQRVKEALKVFGYTWDYEKYDKDREWFHVYLNALEERSSGVWYFEILQTWLD